jgi:Ca-activated chloride channel homolog
MDIQLFLPAGVRRPRYGFLGLVFAVSISAAIASAQQPANPPAPGSTPSQSQQSAAAQQNPSATQPAANANGQQPASGQNSDQPTITIQANEVNLIFTVTDKHGHYIPNLKQSDFALLDDGKSPARVTSFRQQINLPLRVGLVIDASTSIRTRFEFEQQSATEFLLQIVKPASDRAFVMDFAEVPHVIQDWTNNLDALETGINKLKPAGGTALFDSVYVACRSKLLDTARGQEPVRKAMVLISDGEDNQSRVHEDEAIKECQRAETIVYAISTNWTPSRGKGDKVLTDMAEATGGQVFFPPSVEEMSNSFHDIEQELRSQYALTYVPADFRADGAFRPIYLYSNDRRYQVRARKGYFAPKP